MMYGSSLGTIDHFWCFACSLHNAVSDDSCVINPRRACAARVTVLGLCVCVCVYMYVTQHLTLRVSVHAANHTSHLWGDEGRKF